MMKLSKLSLVVALTFLQVQLINAQPSWHTLENSPFLFGRHDDVFFINPQVGWVVNVRGEIYKTTDGGLTWGMPVFSEPSTAFRSVGFADSLHGWAGSLAGDLLWQTSDGGIDWTPVSTYTGPKLEGICGISVVSDSVIYAVGRYDGPPVLVKSLNGGQTWIGSNMNHVAQTLVDIHFFTPDSGFAVGGGVTGEFPQTVSAVVLFTEDGGNNWVVRHATERAGEWCWKISFTTRQTGVVSIERNGFTLGSQHTLRTTDGGVSWEEVTVGSGFRIQGVGMITESLGWAGGGQQTYETTDGGVTWQVADFDLNNVNRFRFFGDTLAYAVGKKVYKYSAQTPTAVSHRRKTMPENFRLEQNYPNPFNPTTTIAYLLNQTTQVRLRIFNVSGKTVKTLVSDAKPAGRHEVSFDGARLASGVYYYRLEAGDFVDSKKMILIK
ncbi:MAG: T9SS type A sorting domain-containing protein [Calditrichaeota bacterium]|nr:T9SS type A sorting domain-containing protein [Calditrichota bacterium]